MGDYVCEDLLSDGLTAEVPSGGIWSGADKGFAEDVAGEEEGVKPSTASGV